MFLSVCFWKHQLRKSVFLRAAAAACLLVLALPASAQWKDWDYDLDQEKKPWQELQTKIPAYPKPENLLKFETGSSIANTFYVDVASLSVGDDGVVRYSLMIKAGGGAINVSFEGMRCDTREMKVYAFGRPNNDWSRARDNRWRYIEAREINNHHLVLYRQYFCPSARGPAPLKQIMQTLKNGPSRLMD